jgi:hypothetical protein
VITLPPLEKRLQRRYRLLVMQHLRAAGPLTTGLSALPGLASAFASTQAAWRFYANPRTTLPALAQPLLDAARAGLAPAPAGWGLVVHDRSLLAYPRHTSKADRAALHPHTRGYELTCALLVDGATGGPMAPLELCLRAAGAAYSTRDPDPAPDAAWLDELLGMMRAAAAALPGRRLIHVIDREGDSVGHYRQWAGDGQTFLARADAGPRARFEGEDLPLGQVAQRLAARGAFRPSREVEYHGRPARQEVAEAAVVLVRPAWRNRRRGQARRGRVAGSAEPLPLRLVVSRVWGPGRELLAEWLLLTNAPEAVPAEQAALWYYWRWRVESYFKLLKSAGQQLEGWQQETAAALAKRLVVASMACVVVWRLARARGGAAARAREALTRLSGRQMKWGVAYTGPALLAGMWVLLAGLAAVEQYGVEGLQALQRLILGGDTS